MERDERSDCTMPHTHTWSSVSLGDRGNTGLGHLSATVESPLGWTSTELPPLSCDTIQTEGEHQWDKEEQKVWSEVLGWGADLQQERGDREQEGEEEAGESGVWGCAIAGGAAEGAAAAAWAHIHKHTPSTGGQCVCLSPEYEEAFSTSGSSQLIQHSGPDLPQLWR